MNNDQMASYSIQVKSGAIDLWKNGRPILSHMDIELTERCNNNCIHCYINKPIHDPDKARESSTDMLKKILDEAASLGCMSVTYTGGEPMLREDFEELYVYARRLGMSVIIKTNVTLITPRLAGLFSRIPPGAPIMITSYGTTKSTYEAVARVRGSFEAFRKGIDLLIEHNVQFEISTTITRLNFQDVDAYESWLNELRGQELSPSYSLVIDLTARRDTEKNKSLERIRLEPEKIVRIQKRRGPDYDREMKEFCSKFIGPQDDVLFSCGSCLDSCALDAYGNLQPCLELRHPDVIYNLRNGSIRDAMTRFFPEVRRIKARNSDYLSRCAHCFLKGLCELCPAKSWMEHGTLDTPADYLCEVAHAQARDLGLLAEYEKAWEVKDWRKRINSLS